MNKQGTISETRIITLVLLAICLFTVTGCEPPVKEPATTGKVTVVVRKEVKSAESGEISIITERLEEIAEKSVADKGANSLMTAQRVVTPGCMFSSYDVGKGDLIVASLFNQEGRNGSDIWVFGNGKTRITNSNYFNNTPTFSSEGTHIYFSSTRTTKSYGADNQNSYIWKMVASGGGGITRIGTPVFFYSDVIESPDGMYLLFCARDFYENSSFIWYCEKNGNLPTQLTQGSDARWMSDDKIVFSSRDENSGLSTIWTLRIDGSELTQVISDAELDCISPVSSPDGRHIAYVKQKPGEDLTTRDIFIQTIESGLSQQITTNISRDDMPQWSETGDSLYFRSTRGVSWNIWKVSTKFLEQ